MKKSLDEFERLMKTFPSRRAVTVSEGRTYAGTFSITTLCLRPACKLVSALNAIPVLETLVCFQSKNDVTSRSEAGSRMFD